MPATFSRLIVEEYLRGEVGYRGVIVSDDLEMGAIGELCPIGEATVRAAAPDTISSSSAILPSVSTRLIAPCSRPTRHRSSRFAASSRAPRASTRSRPSVPPATTAARARRARRRAARQGLATRAATCVAPITPAYRRALNGRVLVIFPRLSELAARITVEDVMQDEARFVREALAPYGVEPDVEIVAVEPGPSEITRVAAAARAAAATVFFLYDAHLYPSNRDLLNAIQDAAPALGVVLMRDPWDAEWLRPGWRG